VSADGVFPPVGGTQNKEKKMENISNQAAEAAKNSEKYTRREALGTIGQVVAASAIGLAVMSQTAQAQSLNLDFVVAYHRTYLHSYAQYSWESRIFLYSGTGATCALHFIKDGVTIPANSVSSNGLLAYVYFPRHRFAEVRDFLRYEKPVRITVVASNGVATLGNEYDELVGDYDI
jgi:hypothetical protein